MNIEFDKIKLDPTHAFEKVRNKIIPWLQAQKSNSLIHPRQKSGIEQLAEMATRSNIQYSDFSCLLPLLTKKEIFSDAQYLRSIISPHPWVKIIPAAGTSRSLLSFRIANREREFRQFVRLSKTICAMWDIDIKKALIINGYPTGVSIPDGFNSIECSSKPEVIALSLASFRQDFQSILFIGQPHFLKYCVLHGFITAEDYEKMFFLVGGALYPHSLIGLMSHQLGVPAKDLSRKIISLYGIAEIGLGIGMETPDLANLRTVSKGANAKSQSAPHVFAVDSERFFLESVNDQVCITVLDAQADMPLIRYNAEDSGFLVDLPSPLTPPYLANQTFLALYGRKPSQSEKYPILEQEVEDRINQFPEIFGFLTGNFLISERGVIFEKYPDTKDDPSVKEKIRKILDINCPIQLTDHLIYEGGFWTDLMRKPRVYSK